MNLIRKYRDWRRYSATVRELSNLSNRELADIGIRREQIESVVMGGRGRGR